YYMNQMLRAVVTSGTARSVAISGYDLAGKTGTTSDYKDAWFVGYTGGFVTAVWVGRDDNTPMNRVTGGGAPAAIWRQFRAAALRRLTGRRIPRGPAPPEGYQPAGPRGDLIGGLEGLFGGGGQVQPAEPHPRGQPPAEAQPQSQP